MPYDNNEGAKLTRLIERIKKSIREKTMELESLTLLLKAITHE